MTALIITGAVTQALKVWLSHFLTVIYVQLIALYTTAIPNLYRGLKSANMSSSNFLHISAELNRSNTHTNST